MHHNGDNALFDVGEGRGRGENGILRRVSVSRQTESAMQLNGRVSRTSTTPATPVTAADINERLCVCVCVCVVSLALKHSCCRHSSVGLVILRECPAHGFPSRYFVDNWWEGSDYREDGVSAIRMAWSRI